MTSANRMCASGLALVQFLFVGLIFLSVWYFLGYQQEYKSIPAVAKDAKGMTEVPKLLMSAHNHTRVTGADSELQRQLNTCKLQRMKDEKPEQDDPDLVEYTRTSLLIAPDFSLSRKLTDQSKENPDRSQYQQTGIVRQIFEELIKPPADYKGFFIEVGAHDGEFLSNTLWFEVKWKWTGLLIETDPVEFSELTTKNRKAWLTNVCLSPTEYAGKYTFFENVGAPDPSGNGLHKIAYNKGKVQREIKKYCLPLYTLLLAINQPVVDLFSLDIEGAELDILKTIPFDKVHIKVLTIETEWIPGGDGANKVKSFMNEHGYKLYKIAYDSIFVHSKYLPNDFK